MFLVRTNPNWPKYTSIFIFSNEFDADIKKHAVTTVTCHKYVHLDTFWGKTKKVNICGSAILYILEKYVFVEKWHRGNYFWI